MEEGMVSDRSEVEERSGEESAWQARERNSLEMRRQRLQSPGG